MNICKKCGAEFEIFDKDLEFYKKIDSPAPTFCPLCRLKRRMMFRNERHLYSRKCDLCNKDFLAIYDKNAGFPVYCYDCWWSHEWDAKKYAAEYNPNLPFFEQLKSLFNKVPHLGIVISYCENSEYANYTNYSKNCYLAFGCHESEDSYYGWRMHNGLACVDCTQTDRGKYLYECVDCNDGYELFFSQDCENCTDSYFLYDCKSCQDCMFSTGLRNKKNYIFNKKYTPEEYKTEKAKFDFGSNKALSEAKEIFKKFLLEYPRRALFIVNSENSFGDHIINSKDVRFGFNVKDIYEGAYLESCNELKDAMDSCFCGWPAELNYEGISAGCVNSYNVKFTSTSWTCVNVEYSESCHHSKDLFGCYGLRHKNSFCILNKQYEPSEYLALKKKIIEDMKARKEYGEFFPAELSPFAYNEAVVFDYYPLTREQALNQGFSWKEPNPKDYLPQVFDVPDKINDVPDSITKEILACEKCGKNYKIVAHELLFYRKFNLPIPRNCFDCRHQSRMHQRSSQNLYERKCDKCGTAIKSVYADNRPEKVYCEGCYLGEVY
ncbi:MAG: hypothetical protein US89_C0010G0011 [Candidatus Peregrinibacteria bacterium GW2011_GWF2_38_29]|nr:MAG: hypothetical protein US89_C0010G0011 [Candidatus Peregrinibacteria bacterium GW2011_GWF2_38_29]HBB02366.1 hypothetical protein [Candidatus Peregrinibacteria bacterium]